MCRRSGLARDLAHGLLEAPVEVVALLAAPAVSSVGGGRCRFVGAVKHGTIWPKDTD